MTEKAKCIFEMTAEELIENKNLCLNNKTRIELEYKQKEADLLLTTNFEKVIGKNRPTVGDKEAYITQQLKSEKEALENSKISLTIINDLIKLRLIEMEGKSE